MSRQRTRSVETSERPVPSHSEVCTRSPWVLRAAAHQASWTGVNFPAEQLQARAGLGLQPLMPGNLGAAVEDDQLGGVRQHADPAADRPDRHRAALVRILIWLNRSTRGVNRRPSLERQQGQQ